MKLIILHLKLCNFGDKNILAASDLYEILISQHHIAYALEVVENFYRYGLEYAVSIPICRGGFQVMGSFFR